MKCGPKRSTLTIVEDGREEPEKYLPEPGFQTKAMDDLVRIEDISDADSYRHKVADWKTTCQLGSATYAIQASPWNWSNHVGGMCGAGSPEIELTVLRNGRRLLDKLVFGGTVTEPGTSNWPCCLSLSQNQPEPLPLRSTL